MMRSALNRNKWLRYKFMAKDIGLAPYMPETKLFTAENLRKMINSHEQVILKPVVGSRGFGVIKVSSVEKNHYETHTENKKTVIQGFENTVNHINNMIGSQRYMVQQRVRLAEIKNCPFDIRVIVQRKTDSRSWRVTGKAVKVAGKGYIVTNITRSKGRLLTVKTAIQQSTLDHIPERKLISKINNVALLSAQRLTKLFPGHRIYGLDMGLDQDGHTWIIEANRSPMMSHFRKMKDQSMYRRIMAYKAG